MASNATQLVVDGREAEVRRVAPLSKELCEPSQLDSDCNREQQPLISESRADAQHTLETRDIFNRFSNCHAAHCAGNLHMRNGQLPFLDNRIAITW